MQTNLVGGDADDLATLSSAVVVSVFCIPIEQLHPQMTAKKRFTVNTDVECKQCMRQLLDDLKLFINR
jgi:hypothetical protein